MAEQATEAIISFKWNNHRTTFFNVLASLRAKEICTDATLGCEGKLYPVHKLVLCASSDYFCDIFKETRCKSPVVILKDIHHNNLEALLDYMYQGEVEIPQKDLPDLIAAAECLHIKGLAMPDDLVLTPKELSPIKKEELSTYETYPSDNSNKLFSPVTNFNDSKLGLQSSNSTFESDIVGPLLKRPKQESREDLKLNDSKNFSHISKNICKAVNAVEVQLLGHSSRHQTSLNHLANSSCLIQKKGTENETPSLNTSIKKVQLKRKRSSKKSLSMKESDLKICNRDGVITVKVGEASLDEVKKTLNSENEEEKSLRNIDNVDSNQFDETENSNKLVKSRTRKFRTVEERNHICEEFCDEIGLPKFSESLTPYLHGHNLETKERKQVGFKLIDELSEHLNLHSMLKRMDNKMLICIFYRVFQLKILEKYPNIIREECNQKKGKKGPLSYLMNKLSIKMCLLAKKHKEQAALQNNESSSSNDVTEKNQNLEIVDGSRENEDIDSIVTPHPNLAVESYPDDMEMESDDTEEDEDFSLYETNPS